MVGLLQVGALIYGLSVVADARPVALVFAVDRFTLVAANGVRMGELPFASDKARDLSWRGPQLWATRESTPSEVLDSVALAAQGFDLAQRPTYWQPYEAVRVKAVARAQPVDVLRSKHGLEQRAFCALFVDSRCPELGSRYLPLEAKAGDASVVLNASGAVLAVVPLNGFE